MPRPAPKHTIGPVPYGFDLDAERFLVPSARPAAADGTTERDHVVAVFDRIAAGANPYAEAKRLNALGVPAPVRYAGQDAPTRLAGWRPTRVAQMVRNPMYRWLVGDEVFARANAVLDGRRVGRRTARPHPLTGLAFCGVCGSPYVAQTQRWRGWPDGVRRYYACAAARSPAAYGERRCAARAIPADWLETVATDSAAGGGSIARIRVDQDESRGRQIALVAIERDNGQTVIHPYLYSPRRGSGMDGPSGKSSVFSSVRRGLAHRRGQDAVQGEGR